MKKINMKFLTGNDSPEAIKQNAWSEIAVAHIGTDWKTYLPYPEKLNLIIISPTIGTCPRAVIDLARIVGWKKIFFLNSLNAKVYLGKKSAIVGSANLTGSNLNGDTLIEACVEIHDEENLHKIRQMMKDLMERAKLEYPTITKKKKQLAKLEQTLGSAIANQVAFNNKEKLDFLNFEILDKDQFYVLWYQPNKLEYSDEFKRIQNTIKDETHFHPNDKIKTDKWALLWEITSADKPHMGHGRIKWLYINDFQPDAIIDEGYEYTTCAIQKKDRPTPTEPFEITRDVEIAFKKTVIIPEIAKYFIQKGTTFDLSYSYNGFSKLIETMKDYMRSNSQD